MEVLLAHAVTASTVAYVHAWHAMFAWARAVDSILEGSRGLDHHELRARFRERDTLEGGL